MIPLYCLTPKTSTLVQGPGTYLLKPSYSQFYVQIVNFSLPWQQGGSGANLNDTQNWPTSKTPSLVQESGTNTQICVMVTFY